MTNFFHKRPTLSFTFLLTLLAALFLHRVLFPAEGMALAGLDVRSLFLPWWEFARTAVLSGHLPLWDANSFSGYPFLSNPQVALFYPLNWPLLLLPVRFALSWHVLVHLVIAGLGMFLLVQHLSGSRAGAWLAALTFAFSGFMAARIWAGHPSASSPPMPGGPGCCWARRGACSGAQFGRLWWPACR